MEEIKVSFSDEALDFIVDKAVEFGLGARGLRSICEAIMLEPMYDLPSDESAKELVIDLDFVKKQFDNAVDSRKLKVA